MDSYKSRNDVKVTYIGKNKMNGKKKKYHDHKSNASITKTYRCFVHSQLNKVLKQNDIEDYTMPLKSKSSYTWWDCKPYKPKVYSTFV